MSGGSTGSDLVSIGKKFSKKIVQALIMQQRQHTAGQKPTDFHTLIWYSSQLNNFTTHSTRNNIWDYYCLSLVTNGTIFEIGRLYIPLDVCTVITRTFPSGPGWTSLTRARIHCVGAVICSPRRHTMSPIFRFEDGVFHFAYRCRWHKYSLAHLSQTCWTIAWHKCQCFTNDADCGILDSFSRASKGHPMRKRPGFNAVWRLGQRG